MNEEQRFISFYDENSDNFDEVFNEVRAYLRNNNKEYYEVYKKIHDIIDNNITLQKLLDGDISEDGLSKEDCLCIAKIIHLYYDLQHILEKEVYFKGGMDAYYYFCKLGIIK